MFSSGDAPAQRTDKLMVWLVAGMLVIVPLTAGLITFRDYGESADENHLYNYAQSSLDAYRHFFPGFRSRFGKGKLPLLRACLFDGGESLCPFPRRDSSRSHKNRCMASGIFPFVSGLRMGFLFARQAPVQQARRADDQPVVSFPAFVMGACVHQSQGYSIHGLFSAGHFERIDHAGETVSSKPNMELARLRPGKRRMDKRSSIGQGEGNLVVPAVFSFICRLHLRADAIDKCRS